MANTVIGASVDIEFKSIKDLKTALSETEKQFKEMVDTFGEGSEQAQQAQKKLASLQDGINQKTEEYNNKVDAAAATVSALNATVGGLQGALELTGLASEETEKALSKVTAALSIGDAIQNLTEFGPMLVTTFNTIKTGGINAFKALRTAIGTTGIGLLVIAAATIAMYWDDIKQAVTGYNSELDKANDKSRENLKTLDFEIERIEKSRDTRKAQGQTEEQINKLLLDRYVKQAEENAAIFQRMKAQRDAEIAASKRNYNIVKNITRFAIEAQAAVYRIIGGPLDLLIMAANEVSEILGFGKITTFSINEEITKMTKGLSEAAAQKLFDPKEVDENINKAELAALEAQNRVDKLRAEMNADNAKKSSEAANKLSADAAKAAQERMAVEKELTTFLEGEYEKRNNIGKSQLDLEIENIRKSYDEKIALAKKHNLEIDQLEMARLGAVANAVNKETKDRKTGLENNLGNFKAQAPKIAKIDNEITVNTQTEANTRKQIARAEAVARMEALDAVSQSLLNASDILGKNTTAGKSMAIAAATISMLTSAQKAYEATVGIPIVGPVLAPINAALAIAAGIKNIKEIAKVKVPGGGGVQMPSPGSVTQTAAPMTPTVSPAVQGQMLNAEAINNLGNTALRAYVMNSDIQNNSQRNAYLQRNARLG